MDLHDPDFQRSWNEFIDDVVIPLADMRDDQIPKEMLEEYRRAFTDFSQAGRQFVGNTAALFEEAAQALLGLGGLAFDAWRSLQTFLEKRKVYVELDKKATEQTGKRLPWSQIIQATALALPGMGRAFLEQLRPIHEAWVRRHSLRVVEERDG